MWVAEYQIHQKFVFPLYYYAIIICTTDANRSEKKDQVIKIYVYILHG